MFKKIFIISILFSLNSYAEVITDGTLGQQINLSGPNFQITSDLGQQYKEGGNLFHSFQDFNLNSSESATFSGPDSVTNIINRVTGGNPSNIDGLIRSTIPNAGFYFLNPYGIMFGENASLDVQGSFHASTAHYLNLGENKRFYSILDNESILSVASPSAFGFLDNNIESIDIIGENVFLEVSEERELSMIGGNINIEDSILYAPSGRINLVSIASKGTVEKDTLNINANKQGEINISHFSGYTNKFPENDYGKIIIGEYYDDEGELIETKHAEYNNLDVSNYTNIADAGQIFIRGGKLLIEKAGILADTYDYDGEPKENTGIDIEITGDIELIDNVVITADNRQINVEEKSGDINITAENLIFSQTEEYSENSGNFEEEYSEDSGDFIDKYLGLISTDSFGPGTAGDINIKLSGLLDLNLGGILSIAQGSDYIEGNGGNIEIEAREIIIQNNGMISADTFGENAGDITIIATDSIYLIDTYIYEEIIDGTGGISSCACEDSFGKGGNIKLITPNLILDYAEIGVFSKGEGDAGFIDIEAEQIELNYSGVYAESENAGGGDINLNIRNMLYMTNNSEITTETYFGEQAGNIKIDNSKFVILDKSQILAGAYEKGSGGNIKINADYFIPSYPFDKPNSNVDFEKIFPEETEEYGEFESLETFNIKTRLDATSKAGQNGKIWINASEFNFEKVFGLSNLSLIKNDLRVDNCIMPNKYHDSVYSLSIISSNRLSISPTDIKRHFILDYN